MPWTEEQQRAIEARNCDLLVAAAAGSGKTAVLVERIYKLVCEGADIERMLIVTFTNAVAAEMREGWQHALKSSAMMSACVLRPRLAARRTFKRCTRFVAICAGPIFRLPTSIRGFALPISRKRS